MATEIKTEHFEYLDRLRESGDTNMFAAMPYVHGTFPELGKAGARAVLKAWMETFGDGTLPAEERVKKVRANA